MADLATQAGVDWNAELVNRRDRMREVIESCKRQPQPTTLLGSRSGQLRPRTMAGPRKVSES